MTNLFRNLAVGLVGLLTVSMLTSCGGDEDIGTDESALANFVSAAPPSGSAFAVNGSITLTFDNAPTDVTVSAGTAAPVGKMVIVNGPFPPGPLSLTVTWADGTQVLNYTITTVCCSPPIILGGSVEDGDTDVDPDIINSEGKIEIAFNKAVTGSIALQTEDGEDVGWIGKVEGDTGTLEFVKGRELVNETVYVIAGKLADGEGHTLNVKITFVTKGKA